VSIEYQILRTSLPPSLIYGVLTELSLTSYQLYHAQFFMTSKYFVYIHSLHKHRFNSFWKREKGNHACWTVIVYISFDGELVAPLLDILWATVFSCHLLQELPELLRPASPKVTAQTLFPYLNSLGSFLPSTSVSSSRIFNLALKLTVQLAYS
jgi:hypothetical protein